MYELKEELSSHNRRSLILPPAAPVGCNPCCCPAPREVHGYLLGGWLWHSHLCPHGHPCAYGHKDTAAQPSVSRQLGVDSCQQQWNSKLQMQFEISDAIQNPPSAYYITWELPFPHMCPALCQHNLHPAQPPAEPRGVSHF